MLKKAITSTDFNDVTSTDVFYFNLTKPELVELEVEFEKGLQALIEQIIEDDDKKNIVAIFKRIILLAYGEKSEDGKRFIKSEEMREAFSQTNAYAELFMELSQNEGAAAEFLIGILPKDLGEVVEKAATEPTPKPV